MNTCESGEATGNRCRNEATKTVEWMPHHLRSSHEAAGNSGLYPQNGAHRLHVCEDCAEMLEDDE